MMNTDRVIPEGQSDVPCLSSEELARLREQAVAESSSLASSYLKEVERHLWIAFELAPNLADIPENRAIFITHLTEAEQLSRSREELYRRIRQMRKHYQKTGIIPDWDSLSRSLYEAMDDS